MFGLILIGFIINSIVNFILMLYRIPFIIRMSILTGFMVMVIGLAQLTIKWDGSQSLYIAFGMLLSPLSILIFNSLTPLLNRLNVAPKIKD